MATRKLTLYADLETRKLLAGPNTRALASSPQLVQGDTLEVEFHAVRLAEYPATTTTEIEIPDTAVVILGVGHPGRTPIASLAMLGTLAGGLGRTGTFSLNTAEVEAFLSGAYTKDTTLEVEMTLADGTVTTLCQTGCTVINDLVTDGAAPPTMLPAITAEVAAIKELLEQGGGGGTTPDATTEVKGKVELATTAEAIGGTDTERAVTPAGLAAALINANLPIENASTTVHGIVRLATTSEITAGIHQTAVVTAAGLKGALDALPPAPTQVNADWNAASGVAQILNKPTLATVATTGAYADLSGKPVLATVATSGSYADLTNKPTIPAAQVNSDWTASSGVAQILNKPALASVATSGAYADLTGKPTLNVIDGPGTIITATDGSPRLGIGAALSDGGLNADGLSGFTVGADNLPRFNFRMAGVSYAVPIGGGVGRVVVVSGTTYTITAADAGETLVLTNAGACALTVQDIGIGNWVNIRRAGGAPTFTGSGVTLNWSGWTGLTTISPNGTVTLSRVTGTVCDITGGMA